jgi:DNA polymerase (family 10)
LDEIATLLRFGGESRFKIDAYERAAQIVELLGDELAERVEEDRLREIEGIGPALSRQIQELWNTGGSALLNQLRSLHPPGAAELSKVSGMTARRTRAIYEALGVTSVEQLRAACAAGQVRGIAGFGPKTEQKLLQASERWLKRDARGPQRLLLADGLELLRVLQAELADVSKETFVVGAARRGEELLDELELAVVGDLEPVFERLASLRKVVRVDRAAGVAHLVERVVLRLHQANDDNVGTVLVRSTGSAAHWAALEARRHDLGQRGFGDERELYAELGLAFVPPELRGGAGELEQAERGGFDDLLELSDIWAWCIATPRIRTEKTACSRWPGPPTRSACSTSPSPIIRRPRATRPAWRSTT